MVGDLPIFALRAVALLELLLVDLSHG